jgi:predicted nucleic acid-binding protein
VIVVDSSAWVEFLRQTDTPVDRMVDRLIRDGADLAVTEIVVMEVLAGARSARHFRDLRARLLAFRVLTLPGLIGFERAAELYRACRSGGETIRRINDCLVAVPVIAAGASVLHLDRDFDVLARHTPLRVEPVVA